MMTQEKIIEILKRWAKHDLYWGEHKCSYIHQDDIVKCADEIHVLQGEQCQKRDEIIKVQDDYIRWLKTKPLKNNIAHAGYDTKIEQLKSELQ